jgi:pimeloyl-ACP methyl ester carboxylesterase
MAHGFSAVRDQRLDAFAERFAAEGLACLLFDYRHFGDSDGEPRQLLDIRRQLDDWRSAIAFARSLPAVDGAGVALWGTSFSGGHVVALAAEDPGLAAVVSQVPFTDGLSALRAAGPRAASRLTGAGLRDQARALLGRPPFYLPAVGPPGAAAAMTAPEAEPGFRRITGEGSSWRNRYTARVGLRATSYRPYARLRRVACPVLVVVADRDQTTPTEPAIRAAERSPRARLVRYPVGHFEVYTGEWFERAVSEEAAFLVEHLLGRAPTSTAATTAGP